MVSDVPDNTLDALASGPTMPDSTSIEDCYAIAEKYELLRQFPASRCANFSSGMRSKKLPSPTTRVRRARWWPILSNAAAVDIRSGS